jgi:hypothetical protein
MLQMPAQIIKFEEENVLDSDLPFIFRNDEVYRETGSGHKRTMRRIILFQSAAWKPVHLDSFQAYQYQLTAPIFKLSWTPGEKVLHYPLRGSPVLPFMRDENTAAFGELGTTFGTAIRRQGGTSIVSRVKIHVAHFNASPDTVCITNGSC